VTRKMNLPLTPLFVCLEGLDGTGKSTQCEMLVDWLQGLGRKVVFSRDPGSTELGNQVRQLLLGHKGAMSRECEMSLFFAARAQMVDEIIRPALNRGHDVVLDRFLLSTIAYQGYGAGLDVARMWQAGRFAAGDLLPEMTLVLDLPAEVALARLKGRPDRMESRGLDYFRLVRQGYIQEAENCHGQIRVISALGDPVEVQGRVQREIIRGFGV
jgi:dTMP kinase